MCKELAFRSKVDVLNDPFTEVMPDLGQLCYSLHFALPYPADGICRPCLALGVVTLMFLEMGPC